MRYVAGRFCVDRWVMFVLRGAVRVAGCGIVGCCLWHGQGQEPKRP